MDQTEQPASPVPKSHSRCLAPPALPSPPHPTPVWREAPFQAPSPRCAGTAVAQRCAARAGPTEGPLRWERGRRAPKHKVPPASRLSQPRAGKPRTAGEALRGRREEPGSLQQPWVVRDPHLPEHFSRGMCVCVSNAASEAGRQRPGCEGLRKSASLGGRFGLSAVGSITRARALKRSRTEAAFPRSLRSARALRGSSQSQVCRAQEGSCVCAFSSATGASVPPK